MLNMTVEYKYVNILQGNVKKLNTALRDVVDQTTARIAKSAQDNIASTLEQKTGQLWESIKTDKARLVTDGIINGRVYSRKSEKPFANVTSEYQKSSLAYALVQEFGHTSSVIRPVNSKYMAFKNKSGRWTRRKEVRAVKGVEYLKKAFIENQPVFDDLLRKVIGGIMPDIKLTGTPTRGFYYRDK